ncbi:MAG TPA: family 20 glycosylhydrolase, partial [Fimbriimonadaceae bacterium]|nr:family 20 glycosylhydrolase [Fimbriimonadaceae bacterium]
MFPVALLGVVLQGQGKVADLVPKPASARYDGGFFVVNSACEIHYTRDAKADATLFADEFGADNHGAHFRVVSGQKRGSGDVITFSLDSSIKGDEGYKLAVTQHRIEAHAKTGAGLFYAGQTIRQLVAAGEPSSDALTIATIPCCEIEDAPSYGWRGLLLDVSRHFRPKADIERYLDIMAFHKLNTFHWHLVDDGGWRIEIKKYPELTGRGAWRSTPKESWGWPVIFPEKHTDDEYGGFYTQADIREILAYAAARHITIVPEIEMPGHSLAAINCYPNIACTKPDHSGPVINSNYCPGKEETFKFLTGVLDEVLGLFPSKFIHIGGDEVDKGDWHRCPDCQARIKSEGLKDELELQSYFVKRIEKYLNSKGRRLIGWDEILEGGLAPNATVMSWRGIEGGIEAAKQGKNAVMCPTSHCYFDYSYAGTPVSKVYSYNPIPDAMSLEQAKLVLGGQGNLWTEWIPTRGRLDQMTWPRAAALAEVFWTPKGVQSWQDFQSRLPQEYKWLEKMGVDFMPPSVTADVNVIIADGPTSVNFAGEGAGNVTLHYTTDGSNPSLTSPVLTGPLTVNANSVVKAAYLNGYGTAGETATVTVHIGEVAAPSGPLEPGLNVGYYEGRWEDLPNFDGLTAASKSIAESISLAPRKRENDYGLRFTGFIEVPGPGTYTFYMTSDDGARLKIAGAPVVDDAGSHAPHMKAGRVHLLAGRYPFQLDYFQIGGAAALKVEVEGP